MSFNITHQSVHWDIDFDNKTLKGKTELTLKVLSKLSVIKLNLRQCTVEKSFVNGIAAAHKLVDPIIAVSQDPDGELNDPKAHSASEYRDYFAQQLEQSDHGELTITPTSPLNPLNPTETVALVMIEFTLVDPLGGIHFVVPRDNYFLDRPSHAYTSTGVCESRLIMPCVDLYGEEISRDASTEGVLKPQYPTWDLQFTVPEGMTAVCSGSLHKQMKLPDGRSFFRYSLNSPTKASGIGFAVGPFSAFPDEKSQAVTHFCLPGLEANLRQTVRVYPYVEEFFNGLLKTPIQYSSHQLVFVEECVEPLLTFAGLSILSCSILSSERIIDHTFNLTRRMIARARVGQYFTHAVAPKTRLEAWIIYGIIGYLTGLFLEYTFGMNEYKYYIEQELNWTIEHDHDRREPLSSKRHTHAMEHCSEFVQRKSAIIMRMLERLVGKEGLLEIFSKLIEGAGDVNDDDDSADVSICDKDVFRQLLEESSQKKLVKRFYENWVDRPGYAKIEVKFVWEDPNANILITQPEYDFFEGELHVGIQDIDSYNWTPHRINSFREEKSVHIEPRLKRKKEERQKKKRVSLATDSFFDIDLTEKSCAIEWPVLWISVDPQFEWYRKVTVVMDIQMWVFAAKYERRINEQLQAIRRLGVIKTAVPKLRTKAFRNLALIAQHGRKKQKNFMFWRVRCEAFKSLAKLASNGDQVHMSLFCIKEFQDMFGVPRFAQIVGQNDFDNFEEYFIQRSMVEMISSIRESETGEFGPQTHKKAYQFVKDLIDMNDNSENLYDDSNYVGILLQAAANTVNVVAKFTTAEQLRELERRLVEVLDSISRLMNMDKITPSFQQTVTQSGILAIFDLMDKFVIPLQTQFFKEHSFYGHIDSVRDKALSSLAKLVAHGDKRDIDFLLEVAENDPVPGIRESVLAHLAIASPFDNVDDCPLETKHIHAVMSRVWRLMNSYSAYDARSRIAALNFFETILPVKKARTTGSIQKFSLGGGGASIKMKMSLGQKDTL